MATSTFNAKHEVLQAIKQLPVDATLDDAMDRVYFLHKIEQGLADADAGRTLSHAQVKQRIAKKWQR